MLCFIIVGGLAGFLRTRPNVADYYYVFHLTASAKKKNKKRKRKTNIQEEFVAVGLV